MNARIPDVSSVINPNLLTCLVSHVPHVTQRFTQTFFFLFFFFMKGEPAAAILRVRTGLTQSLITQEAVTHGLY